MRVEARFGIQPKSGVRQVRSAQSLHNGSAQKQSRVDRTRKGGEGYSQLQIHSAAWHDAFLKIGDLQRTYNLLLLASAQKSAADRVPDQESDVEDAPLDEGTANALAAFGDPSREQTASSEPSSSSTQTAVPSGTSSPQDSSTQTSTTSGDTSSPEDSTSSSTTSTGGTTSSDGDTSGSTTSSDGSTSSGSTDPLGGLITV